MTDKKRLALLISFTLLVATVPPRLFAQGGPYPTESGKVEYTVGGMQSGKEAHRSSAMNLEP